MRNFLAALFGIAVIAWAAGTTAMTQPSVLIQVDLGKPVGLCKPIISWFG